MLVVFSRVLVIFAMIAVGFGANKAGILPLEAKKYLTDLLMKAILPCMIISSMVGKPLDGETRQETLMVIIGSLAFFIAACLFALFLTRFMKNTPKEDLGVLMVIMVAVNTGFMGFPITKAAFGDHIFFLMVMQNIMLNFYMFFIAVIQMHYGDKEKKGFLGTLMKVFNPPTIGVAVGFFLMIMEVNLPGPVMDFIDMMGDATIPLSMIVVGLQLAGSDFSKLIKNKDLIKASLINIILIPAITLCIVHFLPIPNSVKITLAFASAFPCAVAVVGVAINEKKNSELMAGGVALTTLLSLISLPVMAAILQGLYL